MNSIISRVKYYMIKCEKKNNFKTIKLKYCVWNLI